MKQTKLIQEKWQQMTQHVSEVLVDFFLFLITSLFIVLLKLANSLLSRSFNQQLCKESPVTVRLDFAAMSKLQLVVHQLCILCEILKNYKFLYFLRGCKKFFLCICSKQCFSATALQRLMWLTGNGKKQKPTNTLQLISVSTAQSLCRHLVNLCGVLYFSQ